MARRVEGLLPIVSDEFNQLGPLQFATHHLPLEEARAVRRSSGTRLTHAHGRAEPLIRLRAAVTRSSSSRSACFRARLMRPSS